ncbi:ring-exported protein 3, putative [Plasmodium gaboni]|uniref:Ring-exported protein 3, putative n=1 Tax=Plasmodium gaboni TaxID=647221 RepID=A0ABY0KW40_9APIC|nr:ring-exported protein 3, putative [Plasmodium gaboni]
METRKNNNMFSKVGTKEFIYILFVICSYLNTFNYKYANSYKGNDIRNLSEAIIQEQNLRKGHVQSLPIEETTSQETTSKASTSQATTSKATTSKATTSKATTSQAAASQATTSQENTSQATTSQATTSQATTSQATTSQATTSQATTSKAPTSQATTSQESHEQLTAASLNADETQSNKVSNKIHNLPVPAADSTVSNEFKTQPQSAYERKLFEEWQHLNMFEHSNWVNITVQSCQVLVQGLTSLDDYDAKFKSWSDMVELLAEFRMTLYNESNNVFQALLNEFREARKEKPNENLTPEEEEQWDFIKQTKLEKDIEWKIYQILTWKYWNQKEFPGVDIPDPSVPPLDFDATYDVFGDIIEDEEEYQDEDEDDQNINSP